MIDYSPLITPMIIVSAYFAVGLSGLFLSKWAGHTSIVNEDIHEDTNED